MVKPVLRVTYQFAISYQLVTPEADGDKTSTEPQHSVDRCVSYDAHGSAVAVSKTFSAMVTLLSRLIVNYSFNMYKIAIFGDSYVRRLRDSPFANLQLNNTVVRYFTQDGMSLKDVPTHPAFGAMVW